MSALRHGRVPSPAGSRVASSDTSGDSKRVTIPPSQPCHLIVAITSPTRPSGNRIGLARAGAYTDTELDQDSDLMIWRISFAVSLGVLPTATPAASKASFLASAVPAEPETMAPA